MGRQKKQQLKQRPDGRYRAIYKGLAFYGATSDEAIALRNEYKRKSENGIIEQEKITVFEYGNKWLKISHPSVSDFTFKGLAIHLQHMIDEIGGEPICNIKPLQIKSIYSKHYQNASNSYIKAAKQLYCALFDSAVADGLCPFNPARQISAKPHKGKKGGHRAITEQEREWILTLCKDHRAHPTVVTMLYSGIRPQEAKAIDIDKAVDFKAETIRVMKTAHYSGSNSYEITKQGKTDKANRIIPLLPPVKEALTGKHGLLISSEKGEQCTPTIWKKIMLSYKHQMETEINGISFRWYGRTKEQKKLAEEGKLPPWIEFTVVPYDLRHSFCTWGRDHGVELHTMIEWMGHADAKMIMKIYDEVTMSRSETEGEKLKKICGKGQNEGQMQEESSGTVDK